MPEGIFGHDSFGVGQYFVKFTIPAGLGFAIVDFDTIVQVEVDPVQGQVSEFGIVVLAFLDLFLHFFQPFFSDRYFMGRMAVIDDVLHTADFTGVNLFHAVEVISADPAGGVFIAAVEIDEGLEAILFATVIKPVNRPFLIGLAMVLVEVLEKIVAELFSGSSTPGPQGIGEEFQVSFKVFPAKGLLQPGADEGQQVIVKYSSSVMGTTLSLSGIKVWYLPASHSPPA